MGLLEVFAEQGRTRASRYSFAASRFADRQQYALAAWCFDQAAREAERSLNGPIVENAQMLSVHRSLVQSAQEMQRLAAQAGQTLTVLPDVTPDRLWEQYCATGRVHSRKQVRQTTLIGEFVDLGPSEYLPLLGISAAIGLLLAGLTVVLDSPITIREFPPLWMAKTTIIAAVWVGWLFTSREPVSDWVEAICEGMTGLIEAITDTLGLLAQLLTAIPLAVLKLAGPFFVRMILIVPVGILGVFLLAVVILTDLVNLLRTKAARRATHQESTTNASTPAALQVIVPPVSPASPVPPASSPVLVPANKLPAPSPGGKAAATGSPGTQWVAFICPYCLKRLRFSVRLAGQSHPCPHCQQLIPVPPLRRP